MARRAVKRRPAGARSKTGRRTVEVAPGAGPSTREPALGSPRAASSPAAGGATYLLVLSSRERGGRRFVRLRAPSVLAWFQAAWRDARDGAERRQGELGGEVYGLERLFEAIAAGGLSAPTSEAALAAQLALHLLPVGDVEAGPHFVHVETDDGGLPIEYYFFDEQFLESGEALDRLPSLERRAGEEEPLDEEEEEEAAPPEPDAEPEVDDADEEDDGDPDTYAALLERLMDQ